MTNNIARQESPGTQQSGCPLAESEQQITNLILIYDKAEKQTITDAELHDLIKIIDIQLSLY